MSATGLLRKPTDEFFTNTNVALECIRLFMEHIVPGPDDILIEPSAGSGSFSHNLRGNVYAFDIKSRHSSIMEKDFLTLPSSPWFKTTILDQHVPIHVIGNPPFGRQSSLAKKFIRLCCAFSSSVSFILPKSFKKDSFQRTFPLHFHKVYETDLPPGSFTIGDKVHDVPCVFQIWKKHIILRENPSRQEPYGFVFCKKEDTPDFALRRVGVYAGKLVVGPDFINVSPQSHYFIKVVHQDKQQFVSCYHRIIFGHDNTVGPKSISKTEFISKINMVLEDQIKKKEMING